MIYHKPRKYSYYNSLGNPVNLRYLSELVDLIGDVDANVLEEINNTQEVVGLRIDTDLVDCDRLELNLPHVVEVILRGEHGRFPAWLKSLPALESVKFDLFWRTDLPHDLCELPHLKELGFYTSSHKDKDHLKNLLPTLRLETLHIDSFANEPILYETIAQCTALKALYLERLVGKTETFIFPESWNHLQNLACLHIHLEKGNIILPDWDKLTNLQEIRLVGKQIQNFPLQASTLQNVKKCHFMGATMPLEDVLKVLPKTLQVLGWQKSNLTELPTHIGEFTELRKLEIDENPIRFLPADMLKLTKLRWLGAGKTPLGSATGIMRYQGGHISLMEYEEEKNWEVSYFLGWYIFLQNMQKKGWDAEMQRFAFALFQLEEDYLEKAPLHCFVKALEYVQMPFKAHWKIWHYLQKYNLLSAPETVTKQDVCFLLGNPTVSYSTKKFQQKMKEKGYQVSLEINDSVTCLLIGKNPIGFVSKDLPFIPKMVIFEDLMALLEKPEIGSFAEEPLEQTEEENLFNLLFSGVPANIAVGLQIILQGGLSPAMYAPFFWLWFAIASHKKLQATYNQIAEKYYPVDWQVFSKDYKYRKYHNVLPILCGNGSEKAQILLMYLWQQLQTLPTFTSPYLTYYLLHAGGEPARTVLRQQLKEGVLDLTNPHWSDLVPEIVEFPEITQIRFYSLHNLKNTWQLLTHLPHLQKITIETTYTKDEKIEEKIQKALPSLNIVKK